MSNALLIIQKMLETERDCIKINKHMFEKIGIEPAIIYSFLVNSQIDSDKPVYYGSEKYFPYTVETIQKATTLSAFKQRNALEILQQKGLIKIKMGQSKLRLISVIEDTTVIQNILFDTNIINKLSKNETVQYLLKQINIFQEATKSSISNDIFFDVFKAINNKNKATEKDLYTLK